MFDHLTLTVRNLARSRAFYRAALKPLGYSQQADFGDVLAFGPRGQPRFWLKQGSRPQSPMHLAFASQDRKGVKAFHKAALKAGGKDDGKPGLRPHYHPHYFGSFVVDPDGHHVEAVCHLPEPALKKARRSR